MDIKEEIAAEAVKIVTGARRSTYGKPEDNFARIARLWNCHLLNVGILHSAVPQDDRLVEPRDVAAMMRLMKEARLAETPDHRDSFVDLVGYTLCGAELALKQTAEEKSVDTATDPRWSAPSSGARADLEAFVGKAYVPGGAPNWMRNALNAMAELALKPMTQEVSYGAAGAAPAEPTHPKWGVLSRAELALKPSQITDEEREKLKAAMLQCDQAVAEWLERKGNGTPAPVLQTEAEQAVLAWEKAKAGDRVRVKGQARAILQSDSAEVMHTFWSGSSHQLALRLGAGCFVARNEDIVEILPAAPIWERVACGDKVRDHEGVIWTVKAVSGNPNKLRLGRDTSYGTARKVLAAKDCASLEIVK